MWTKKTPATFVPSTSSTKPSNVKTVKTTTKQNLPTLGEFTGTPPTLPYTITNTTEFAKPTKTAPSKSTTTTSATPTTTASAKSSTTASTKSKTSFPRKRKTATSTYPTTPFLSQPYDITKPTKATTGGSDRSTGPSPTSQGTKSPGKQSSVKSLPTTSSKTVTTPKTKPSAVTQPTTSSKTLTTSRTKPSAVTQPTFSKTVTTPGTKSSAVTQPTTSSKTVTPPRTTKSSAVTQSTKSWKTATTPTTGPSARDTSQHDVTAFTPSTTADPRTADSPYISFKRLRLEKFDDLDGIPSRTPDPVPADAKRDIIEMTHNFIIDQTMLETQYSRTGIQGRREEKQIRYNMKKSRVDQLQKHPYFHRMMRSVVDQWIERNNRSVRYKPNKQYKDTVSTRRRIQPNISNYFIEYAIKFGKRPWSFPGKHKIHTRIYDKVDFVDKPFVITEEKTEKEVKRQTVKSLRRQSW